MARSAGFSVENNFTRALVTEATGLNFPENAVTETDNCLFDSNGIVSRRLGFDLEAGGILETPESTEGAFSEFLWKTVGNDGGKQYIVIQEGQYLSLYEILEDQSLSSQKQAYTVNLDSYRVAGSPAASSQPCGFSSGDGRLIVVHPYCNPILIEYDNDTLSFTDEEIEIEVRDFKGVDDGLEIDTRPSTLSAAHRYNILNQGWYGEAQRIDTNNIATANKIDYWNDRRGDYPSNADIWWFYTKVHTGGDAAGTEALAPLSGDAKDTLLGNTPAATGHYIFNAFDIRRTNIVSSLGNSFNESSSYFRPTCSTFFQGRIWFSGVDYYPYNNKIYFSKIIEGKEDYGKCYQQNDPTSKDVSDLLSSDGGVVVINEADKIVSLFNSGGFLFVFATNGTWVITGPDQSGFAADSYVVRRISSIGCEAPFSVVDVDGAPVWWNFDGIYTATPNQLGTSFTVASISQNTIQTFYEDIPRSELVFVKGAYNPVDRVVQWIYRGTETSTYKEHFRYDKYLNLDVTGQAFYPGTVSQEVDANSRCYIKGILFVYGRSTGSQAANVTNNAGVLVTDSSLVAVTTSEALVGTIESTFKYPIECYDNSATQKISFGDYRDTDLVDLASFGGVDYDSYFTSGYRLRGESQRQWNNHYITITSKQETNSGFLISGRWDYTTSSDASRWTTKQQGYKPDPNRSYTTRKLKIRGKGTVLQYRVDSQSGKPFNIAGWGTFDSVENNV